MCSDSTFFGGSTALRSLITLSIAAFRSEKVFFAASAGSLPLGALPSCLMLAAKSVCAVLMAST